MNATIWKRRDPVGKEVKTVVKLDRGVRAMKTGTAQKNVRINSERLSE